MGPSWKMVKAAIVAAAFLMAYAIAVTLTGCTPTPLPPPEPPPGGATCETACARLQQLGCPAGKPTPKGTPCAAVCEAVNASGLLEWNVDCLTMATSCSTSDRCTR